tara:strand:+ start:538 stop:1278 length:741 start_codon:yes stop_codon:yes gene_type:complete
MAFKMKGSPAKMGGIQGTSGHTSALKTKEDLQHLREMEHDEKGNHLGRYDRKKEMDKDGNPLPMKSPLEQNKGRVTQESTDWDIYNPSIVRSSGTASGFNTARTKGKGDKMRFEPRNDGYSSRHEKEWIHDQVGGRYQDLKNISRKELLRLQNEFYNLYKGGTPVVDGGTFNAGKEKEVAEEQPLVSANQKGEEPSEYLKAVNKGYFNKGEGSEYLANRPSPSDYDNVADFTAAVKKWELTNPEKQ